MKRSSVVLMFVALMGISLISLSLASMAQAETCVESNRWGSATHEWETGKPICLVETFTPSQPLRAGVTFHVRVPSEMEQVRGGTLVEAGPPGGMSTWAMNEPFLSAHVIQNGAFPVEVRAEGKESGEEVTMYTFFSVPAMQTIRGQELVTSVQWRRCRVHRKRGVHRRRTRRYRCHPRLVGVYQVQSDVPLQANIHLSISAPHLTSYLKETEYGPRSVQPGSNTIRISLVPEAALLKRCRPNRCKVAVEVILWLQSPTAPLEEPLEQTMTPWL